MDVTFLFLDESVDLDTAWLTGVFVPAEQYADVRDAMIRITRDILSEAGHAYPPPTELHGVVMLAGVDGVTDEHRLKVFERIVAVVNKERLEVLSVGHVESAKVRQGFRASRADPGDKLYNLNFYEMVDALDFPINGLILPVFDGVPPQQPAGKKRQRQPVDQFAYDAFVLGGHITHWGRIAPLKPILSRRFGTRQTSAIWPNRPSPTALGRRCSSSQTSSGTC